MQRCVAGCGGRGFAAPHAGAQAPCHSCQQLLRGRHPAAGRARTGPALSWRGAVSPAAPSLLRARLSSASRSNPELLNLRWGLSLVV